MSAAGVPNNIKSKGIVFAPCYYQLSLSRLLDCPVHYRLIFLFVSGGKGADEVEIKSVVTTRRMEFVRRVTVARGVAREFWRVLVARYPDAVKRAHDWGASITLERMIRRRLASQLEQAVLAGYRRARPADDTSPYYWMVADGREGERL